VETLAESWVAQLSARSAGSQSADRITTDAAILTGHDILRGQYPGGSAAVVPELELRRPVLDHGDERTILHRRGRERMVR